MNVKQGRNLTLDEALGFKHLLEDKGFKGVDIIQLNSSWLFQWISADEERETVEGWLEQYERECGCFRTS